MTGIERPDWGPPTAAHGARETPGSATTSPEPPATEATQVVEDAAGESQAPAADGDDSALHRKLLADGIFTPEELGRHYGLSDDEIDALSRPLPSRASIDKELAQFDKARRADRTAYFKDDALQKRELQLLEARAKLQAETAADKNEAGADDVSGLAPEAAGARHARR